MIELPDYISLQTLANRWQMTCQEVLQTRLEVLVKIDLKEDTEELWCIKERVYFDLSGKPVPVEFPKYSLIEQMASSDDAVANRAFEHFPITQSDCDYFKDKKLHDEKVRSSGYERLNQDDITRLILAFTGDELSRDVKISEFLAEQKYGQRYIAKAASSSNTYYQTDIIVKKEMLCISCNEMQRLEVELSPQYMNISDAASRMNFSANSILQLGSENKLSIYLGLFGDLYCVESSFVIQTGENEGASFCLINNELPDQLVKVPFSPSREVQSFKYVRISLDAINKIMNQDEIRNPECFDKGFVVQNKTSREVTLNDLFVHIDEVWRFEKINDFQAEVKSKADVNQEASRKQPKQNRMHALRNLIATIYFQLIVNEKLPNAYTVWNYLKNNEEQYEVIHAVTSWTAKNPTITWISDAGYEQSMKKKTFQTYISNLKKNIPS